MNSNTKYSFILLVLPLLFLFFGNNFHRTYYAGDPDYIYLMNAISLSRGVDAGHIDNPGTPVMEIGACVLWIHHATEGRDKDNLQYAVLKNPDKYVNLFRQTFILLIALSLIITGWIVYSKTGNIWSAIIFQITPFLSVNILEHAWTKVSPEPILLFVSTLYAALLVVFYFDSKKRTIYYLIMFSLIGGFGLATKATFLPVLVIPFFLFRSWRYSLYYFFCVIAFFFLFTLPAHAEYHRMFDWFIGLITHKGIYGGGEKGFIDTSLYFENLINIFKNNLFFTFILLISIVAIFLDRSYPEISNHRKGKKNRAVLVGLITANLLGILIVAKHYHANHYLLPVLALSGATLFFSLESIKVFLKRKIYLNGLQLVFILLFLVVFFVWSLPVLQVKNRGYKETNEEYVEMNEIIKCNYNDYLQIYHYPDGLNKFSALNFGNGYSKLTNQDALSILYPNIYFYNIMTGSFQLWEQQIPHEQIFGKHGKKIIITGRPMSQVHVTALNDIGIVINTIYTGMFQAIYELDTLNLSPYLIKIALAEKREIYCNADSLSDDGQEYIAGEYRISSGWTQSDVIARSDKYSVRMDNNEEFAFNFTVDDLYPGQDLECSIWRHTTNQETYLIASAKDSGIFYKGTNQSVEADSAGWQKLELKFSIPKLDPPLERLTFYLWNKDRAEVYFDDLKIILH